MEENATRSRSIIYIGGFNPYYGAVKNTPWKWLDMEKYFSLLRQDDDIQIIKYFTAKIHGSHKLNQDVYIEALSTSTLNNLLSKAQFPDQLTDSTGGIIQKPKSWQ